uniref:Protein kinase domain-containing protein n=1 Tax=Leersia perrieri TaxID=77586 RepID=A0A0D9W3W1_9ORYZ
MNARTTPVMVYAKINPVVSIVSVILVSKGMPLFKEVAKNYAHPGVVACVLVGLIGFLGWEVIQHKRSIKKQTLLRQRDEYFQQHGGQLLLEMMKVEGNVAFTIYERGQIEMATNNFSKDNIIGEGGQGTVYKAVLDNTVVAIKRCKEVEESHKMDFVQELVILCRVNHPNIVKLLGCCLQFEAPMLVYEFVQNKTLQELLEHQRSRRLLVTLGTRLRIAAESSEALAHLHSMPHPIIHGDVKPPNILLAEGWVAKVSDFGCSTIDEKTQPVPKGTPGYLDPDYLLEYQLTAKNDVYSFGVILLELLTGRRPLSKERKCLTSMFQEAMMDGTLHEMLDSDIVSECSTGVVHQTALLASRCLAFPGSMRPTMKQVAEELWLLALSDGVQQCPQPPLVLDGLILAEIGNTTTSSRYATSRTSDVYIPAALLGAGGALPPAPGSNCSTACGGVNVSYPFGFEPGCSLPGFELTCRETNKGKKPFLGHGYVELASVSLLDGLARVWNNISTYCNDTTSETNVDVVALPEMYKLSESGNKFTVVGCQAVAIIGVGEEELALFQSGCVATKCGRRGDRLIDSTCSGAGCCQTTITKGYNMYQVWFQNYSTIFNVTKDIYNVSRCSYAVLMESSSFSFRKSYVRSSEFFDTNGGQVPMVLEWAIRNASNCVEAQKKRESYACVSENSACLNSSSGPGYICSCAKGFHGNPYLLNGCKDINECQDNKTYPCYGECRNTFGSFDCICPGGTKGNATIPEGCRKDIFTPKVRLAIGMAACVLFGLFGFLGWRMIRHKRTIKEQALLRQTDEYFIQHGGQLLLEMMKAEGNVGFTLYKKGEIETATKNFKKTHIVGEGGQGTVYRALIDGVDVAIKKCKEIDESRKTDFVQELVILCRVSHPNIVRLLGCCLQFEAPMLIYEFVQNKTLKELLDLQRSRRFHVTLGTRLRIAAESAEALAHLHSLPHPILHGDVKPANILLAEGMVAKVSDFGCSTIDEKTQDVLKGTPGYIDPEYLLEYQLTAKNDVYSFGVILVELLTCKRTLSKESKTLTSLFLQAIDDGMLIELLDSDIVDEASMGVIHRVAVLASQCLVVPGATRPVMVLVAEELRKLALADEVQQHQQPPLLLDDMNFTEMESTMSTWCNQSKTNGANSLKKKAMLSIQLGR